MDISSFNLMLMSIPAIMTMLSDGSLEIEKEEPVVFDIENYSEAVQDTYHKRLSMINEINLAYGPNYIELIDRKHRAKYNEIRLKYGMPRNTFNRICTNYFQSGMNNYALLDKRALGEKKQNAYHYVAKPGKKASAGVSSGVVLTDEVRSYFEEALREYKSGRQKTIRSAFDRMNNLYFTRVEMINGKQTIVLAPQSERPTLRQLQYYFGKNLTEQEKDLIKTSAAEQRNNKRLIISDSLNGVMGPGDMVEIDACEADVSLVSSVDPDKTVGRPIVYFMIDVYTRIILAVSVAFDNNSILGVTNLFLNLADDKKKYCERNGMGFSDDALWPSNIIPRRLRVDRGSEFKSKEFDRICVELGIEKQIVSGASGSLKGIVEQSFHQMHTRQNVHLEDYGLIEKRYDSLHHKEASLNIEQYTKMVINFVLMHNQQYMENYPITKKMIKENVRPIPAELWEYGVKEYGSPRPIANLEQYLFTMMKPVAAKVSRRGISYKQLWYLNEEDRVLAQEMFKAGKKMVPFKVRMDMRDVGAVYYLRNDKLMQARLNPYLTGNADYDGLTMKEYEDYLKKKSEMKAAGRIHNQNISAFNYLVNEQVVDEAKKPKLSDPKNMRGVNEAEKQKVSASGSIYDRFLANSNESIEEKPIELKEEVIERQTVSEEEGNLVEEMQEPVNEGKKDSTLLDATDDFADALQRFFDEEG